MEFCENPKVRDFAGFLQSLARVAHCIGIECWLFPLKYCSAVPAHLLHRQFWFMALLAYTGLRELILGII